MKSFITAGKDMTRKTRMELKSFYGREVHVAKRVSPMARKISLATLRSNERYNEYYGIR